eukprot:Transcript_14542.p1 GENE.Transcript_14542~~Transcript_14542.p1  ORF type:complete len:444 (-),score=39.66 Transcript_14542:853-2163(-)
MCMRHDGNRLVLLLLCASGAALRQPASVHPLRLHATAHPLCTRHGHVLPRPAAARAPPPLMREPLPSRAARGVATALTELLPFWTLAAAGVGVLCPAACASLGSTSSFARGLALLMLSTGLLLTPRDLSLALRSPKAVLLNACCCFVVAPACALGLGAALGASPDLRAGLVLLGCVSGGQASNLLASLAGGDLALSVVLTVSTTLGGVLVTPALVKLLLGGAVAVDAVAVLRSTASIVLLPLLSGVAAARLLPSTAARAAPACPSVGILATLLLVTGGAANSAAALLRGGAATWKLHVGAVAMVETPGPRRFGQRPPSRNAQGRPGVWTGQDIRAAWGSCPGVGVCLHHRCGAAAAARRRHRAPPRPRVRAGRAGRAHAHHGDDGQEPHARVCARAPPLRPGRRGRARRVHGLARSGWRADRNGLAPKLCDCRCEL